MNNTQINQIFQTTDLSLTGAIALYFPLDSIDKSDPRKAVFLFRREAGLDELVASFWNNTLQVSPQAYFYKLKQIKSRLYEEG